MKGFSFPPLRFTAAPSGTIESRDCIPHRQGTQLSSCSSWGRLRPCCNGLRNRASLKLLLAGNTAAAAAVAAAAEPSEGEEEESRVETDDSSESVEEREEDSI